MRWRKRIVYEIGDSAGRGKKKWFHVCGGITFLGTKWAARFDYKSKNFATLASAKKWLEAQIKLRRKR